MRPEVAEIRRMAEAAGRILVVSHKDADGDALGSALAMGEALTAMGRTALVRVPPPVPGMYAFLPGFEMINADGAGAPPDLAVVMDSSNLERVAGALESLPEGQPMVNIDHHVSNPRFGAVNLIVPEASSTAEVAYDIFHEWGIEITPDIATNLYTGLFTDTGGFRHENTTDRALDIGSHLVRLGANAADIAMRVYKSKKISTLKLQAQMMGTIKFECDDRLVYGYVTEEMLARSGASPDETEGLIDVLNSVDGLELALFFKEIAPGMTKGSIRSRGQANANLLAAEFAGGGHERAAGMEIALPLREAIDQVLVAARRMLTPAG